jgi:AAA15 family ATPase/GTPase
MRYTLKNFKIFDAAGTTFEIEPVTLLIGGNNAGKSSMAKSLLLLENFVQKISNDIASGAVIEWEKYTLNFRNEFHQLGAFDHVLNWGAEEERFEITYQYKSEILRPEDNEIEISLAFVPKKASGHDYSYEAELSAISLLRHGQMVYRSQPDDTENIINFNALKEDYWWYMNQANPTLKKMVNGKKKISYRAFIWGELGRIFDIRMNRNRWIEQKDNGKTFSIARMPELQRAQCVITLPSMSLLESCTSDNIDSKVRLISRYLSSKNKEYLEKYAYVIFEEFKRSEFQTFGDFYRFYESAFLSKLPIPAGFHNNSERMWDPEYYIIYGTNALLGNAKVFSELATVFAATQRFIEQFKWEKADGATKFAYIHSLLQSWAGVSNYEYNQVPNAVVPELSLAIMYSVMLLEEFFRTRTIAGQMHYVELNRANIRRIYTLFDSQGTGFNRLVEQFVSSPDTIKYQDKLIYTKGEYINRWLPRFSNFDEIEFIDAPEGVGFYVYLKHKEDKRISLADVGYGMTPLIALLLHIELVIMELYNSVYLNAEGEEEDIYILQPYYVYIEEPETNLHPNNQALLAELFVDACDRYDIHFILETHSEYLIRKLQNMVKQNEIDAKAVAINNIENGRNHPIHIKSNGAIDDTFAKGFYDEALNLALELRK